MHVNDLDNRFDYHPPRDDRAVKAHEGVRANCKALAEYLNDALLECQEKSLVFTHLEEAMFWANAAIARNDG